MKRLLVLVAGVALYWALGVLVFDDNLGSHVRFFTDNYDRWIYADHGTWLLHRRVPYRDVFSEYPHVATYLFGVPYLFVGDDRAAYVATFALIMSGLLIGTIVLLQRLLPGRESYAYLMLLPAPLYFSLNRFDLLASAFLLLSIWFLQKDKPAATGVSLAAAALTKWFPVFLLPLFVSYQFRRNQRTAWSLPVAFAATSLVIVAPILVLAGLKPTLQPYLFHAGRGLEALSLPFVFHALLARALGIDVDARIVQVLCLGGIGLAVLASVLAKTRSIEPLINWCLVIVAVSVLLSTIWSPQWILWVLPLMILAARRARDLPWIVAYGVLGYLAFPLLYDGIGHEAMPVQATVLIIDLILCRTIVVAAGTT